jgi:hypothetical protein
MKTSSKMYGGSGVSWADDSKTMNRPSAEMSGEYEPPLSETLPAESTDTTRAAPAVAHEYAAECVVVTVEEIRGV